MQEGLHRLTKELASPTSKVFQAVYAAFGTTFPNPFVADREFKLFHDRVMSCSQQKTFGIDGESAAVDDFSANSNGFVKNAELFAFLDSPADVTAPIAKAA